MKAVVGLGVEVTPAGLHAVALDADGGIVGERRLSGVSRQDDLTAALRGIVGALADHHVPIGLAWDDGPSSTGPVDLGCGRPVEVAARVRDWAAVGTREIAVVTDEAGGHWGVAVGPGPGTGAIVRQAADRAGLHVVASEPAALTRARRSGAQAAEAMAAVAAGRLTPPSRLVLPPPGPVREGVVWVIERRPSADDGLLVATCAPRRLRALRRGWRAISAQRRRG